MSGQGAGDILATHRDSPVPTGEYLVRIVPGSAEPVAVARAGRILSRIGRNERAVRLLATGEVVSPSELTPIPVPGPSA
jgi:hypothetical protein